MQEQYYTTDELLHYGVPGMKWGVRRARAAMAKASTKEDRQKASAKLQGHMTKASKKLDKLNTKVEKAQYKARKASNKADRKATSFLASEKAADKAVAKARKKSFKAVKKVAKARKWYEQMDKAFKNTGLTMTAQQQALGKSYLDTLNARANARSLL